MRNRKERDARWAVKRAADNKRFTLIVPNEDYAQLVEAAKRNDCSINEMVRTFIVWGLE